MTWLDGSRVQGLGFRVGCCLGFRILGLGFRVGCCLGVRVWGSRMRVEGGLLFRI